MATPRARSRGAVGRASRSAGGTRRCSKPVPDSPRELVESLAGRPDPSLKLCVEINETAVMDMGLLADLRNRLAAVDVEVAFDDFGTGQPRLFELAEVSPRYVKFDHAWIHDLGEASERRRELVRTLVDMVKGFKITPIAEGIERAEEAEVCAELGFELGQGFYLGRPERSSDFRS